ncbi:MULTISPECIES: hypothetical protein [unclassified Microbacterium]|uniref:hypothetical protein n=1 Tax=unclassified Microbacterium TaxID=2609290 RepID=UPI000EA968AF|nr:MULTISPECIES: hypothetical protein [unclassified Microbacterium]MBT2484096.1 hypothetical protein [Microbacterium sp. ISL-108]RKN67044.1 hypothetical protein D7252_05230 [Microbacterium sp. CGR2]
MSFHIEHTLNGRHHSSGEFPTQGDALLAALGVKRPPVLIVDDASTVPPAAGDVVAAVLKKGEILSRGTEPGWWGSIRETTRRKVLAGASLDANAVADITDAGGTVVATAWESGPIEEWELTPPSDSDWVRLEAACRQVRG